MSKSTLPRCGKTSNMPQLLKNKNKSNRNVRATPAIEHRITKEFQNLRTMITKSHITITSTGGHITLIKGTPLINMNTKKLNVLQKMNTKRLNMLMIMHHTKHHIQQSMDIQNINILLVIFIKKHHIILILNTKRLNIILIMNT